MQREQLADAITRRRGEIEQRWVAQIEKRGPRACVAASELRDSMPAYLGRLAEGLRGSSTIPAIGSNAWVNAARDHAAERLRPGFDVELVVEELVVLRRVLTSVLREDGALGGVQQGCRIADLIDAAIAAAVNSYVESRRMAELIDSMLMLAKGERSLTPKLALATVGQIVAEAVSAAELGAQAKGLRFDASFDPDVVVHVDATLTSAAIDNVVQSALVHADRGDVALVVEDAPEGVVIHVRSSGQRLTPADLDTVFEPLERGGATGPGAGLDLALARRAMAVQGASIDVESETGKGSHFWMTLPKPHGLKPAAARGGDDRGAARPG